MTAPGPSQDQPGAHRHSRVEDAQGLFIGSTMVAVGLAFLQHLGLITGQIAGLALLVSLWTGVSFGAAFFVLNLPFYWLAWRRVGHDFTLKTFLAVGLVSLFSMLQPHVLTLAHLDSLAGSIIAGILMGLGVLAVFRHRASLGGIGVLAVYLQDRFGFRAGWTQMLVDLGVFALAVATLPPRAVLFSLIGAVVLNLVIAINHRHDLYVGM